jgi:signal transduction histidine kinase
MQVKIKSIRNIVLLALGAYRIIALVLALIAIRYTTEKTGSRLSSFQISNLAIFVFTSVAFFFLIKYKAAITVMMLFEYYLALSFSYTQGHFLFWEALWLPGLISVLSITFHSVWAIVIPPLLGLGGAVFLSYGCNNYVSVEVLGFSFPWSALLVALAAPCVVLSALLNRICSLLDSNEKRSHSLERNLKELGKINNAISQRIFTLTNDTTQKERNRLSKEIHDTTGYVFTNIMMMLQAAEVFIYKDTKRSEKLINDTLNYAEKSINEIRYLLRNIRNYAPESISIQNELHDVGEYFQNATNVKLDLHYGEWPQTISKEVESFFISFMQESLTNALKHGHANSISVNCWKMDNILGMTVSDNGTGAELPIKKGIGITAMEDVADELGGEIRISANRYGFSISAVFPEVDKL